MSESNKLKKSLDWRVLGLYLIICFIGILSIFSVQHTDLSQFGTEILSKEFFKQFVWLIISVIVGVTILFTESKFFSNIAFLAYTVGIILMLLVLVIGTGKKGSNSWLDLGVFAFQPGELGKLLTSLALARLISAKDFDMKQLRHKLVAGAMVLVPAGIIIMQNETGLALVYLSFFLLLYREGYPLAVLLIGFGAALLMILSLLIPSQYLLIGFTVIALLCVYFMRHLWKKKKEILYLIVGVWFVCIVFSQVVVPYTFKHVLKGYQKDRIYSMIGVDVPDEFKTEEELKNPSKGNASEYNSRQSKIAISSGGFLGKGFLNGTQTRGSYVPEQSTDFIFCTVGEELGTWGSFLVIGLYAMLLYQIISMAERQRSVFSRVYAYGLASVLFFHIAVNIGMTVGLMPVIGITLPYMSYGGTSLLTFSTMLFILLRLDLDRNAMIR